MSNKAEVVNPEEHLGQLWKHELCSNFGVCRRSYGAINATCWVIPSRSSYCFAIFYRITNLQNRPFLGLSGEKASALTPRMLRTSLAGRTGKK